jgi:hypothetical protein
VTPAQLAILKADILADPLLAAKPLTNIASQEIANAYKELTTFDVWRTDAPVSAINDAIDDTKFTPTDVPSVTQLPAESMLWLNRSQMVLIKQANLQRMLQGRDTIDATKATVRASLKDSLTVLPTGANGANTSAAGASAVNALSACTRKANRFENLFATAATTTGTVAAKVLVLVGNVSSDDVQLARES